MTGVNERVIGIDLGSKRVGLAIGDKQLRVATGYGVIEYKNQAKLIEDLREIVKTEDISTIVIGLPKNMDGTNGVGALDAMNISALIKGKLNADVVLVDERLTTFQAIRQLHAAGEKVGKNRGKIDMMAAILILQNYLDSLG
jgi:putative Holliday junction resolvase